MSEDFAIKIDETKIKEDKKTVYEATLTYKGDNQEFIDYIESVNIDRKLKNKIDIKKLASVTISFYLQFKPYIYNYDDKMDPNLALSYKDDYDGFLNEFYNKITEYKLNTTKFPFLKQLKGISYGMLLCCICKAMSERLITRSSTIILEASGGIIDMDRGQSIDNLVKYYERIGFNQMFPDYYDIAIKSESGFIPMIAQVKDIIRLCNFENISKELLTVLPTDLCKDICTDKEDIRRVHIYPLEDINAHDVSYLCDRLTITYNTNILDSASDIIKEKFLLTSLTHRNGNEGKKVLMNLICNHFDKDPLKQKPMPRFIGGPKNLTVHISKEYDKMIYIFGEYHSDKIDCDVRFGDESSKETWDKPNSKKMRVEYFLSEFIRTTDDFLDIFAEFPIVSKETRKYDDKFTAFPPNIRMNKLLDNFKECLQRDTRTQYCSLARIHYFDIRYYDDKGIKSVSNSISYFFHNLTSNFTFYSGDELIKQLKIFINVPMIKDVLIELAEPDEENFKKIWVNHLTDLSHNVKELDRLQKNDPKMKDKILHFIEKEITEKVMKYRTSWRENVRIIFDNHKYTVSDFLSAFENIHQTIDIINVLYADLYTLLRVFKTFNISEMKQKAYKQATDQPDKAHNIIIYAGDLHSQVYRKFLKEVLHFDKIEVAGKEEPYGETGEATYCIDMKDITQPLFSKYHDYNFIVGNKYESDLNGDPEIWKYVGTEDCMFIRDESGSPLMILDYSEIQESEIQDVRRTKCHVFKTMYNQYETFFVSDTYKLGRIRIHIPSFDLSSLSNFDTDLQKIEESSISTLKKLFDETYYKNHLYKKEFDKYSGMIISHVFKVSYISRDGNTFIDESRQKNTYYDLINAIRKAPKAEDNFYVFRGTKLRNGYEAAKIISGEVIEEKMFGSISTTIFFSYARDEWIGKHAPCCMYLIKVPRDENYLILNDVFTKTNDKLELNNKSQYEVTLAPGKFTFTDIKKITIDGSDVALFVCNYKSFTDKEFDDGFKGPIYNMR